MTIERMTPSGGWLISAMIGGYLVSRRYFGYSKREAIAKFKDETKGGETMNFDSVEFTIAGHWLSPLFNGDYTGLSDSEARQFDSFIARETRGLPAGHWAGGDEEDGAGFAQDEISGMLADCYRVQYCYPTA